MTLSVLTPPTRSFPQKREPLFHPLTHQKLKDLMVRRAASNQKVVRTKAFAP